MSRYELQMTPFRAYRVHRDGDRIEGRLERLELADLDPGDVLIRAAYSSVNYKDALGAVGRAPVQRRHPLIAGVDVAGTVERSDDPRLSPGDPVLVTGCGLGESHNGGFAELVRVPADWVVALPAGLTLWEAMALGTAGFTAALALCRLEQLDCHPALGPVLVTGSTGGVGSIAVDLFAKAGYTVTALTGKREQFDYLRGLGASEVRHVDDIERGERPMETPLWGAAVDTVGGEWLDWTVRTLRPWSAVVAIGLPAGARLETSLMPMLLRGVSVLGLTASGCPPDLRRRVWQRLAVELKPRHLERIASRTVELEDLPQAFERLLDRGNIGRTVVRLNGAPPAS